METNFEINDRDLVDSIQKSEYYSSQENDWENIENMDEIEVWMEEVEQSQESENPEIKIRNEHSFEENTEESTTFIGFSFDDIENQLEYENDVHREMLDFVKNQRTENTKLKTQSDMKKFREFLLKKKEKRNPVDIPPITLDAYIGHFIMEVRKKDGSPYEPGTVTSFSQVTMLL